MITDDNKHLKILVIDDERMVLDVVCQALEMAGFDVLSATSGKLGIEHQHAGNDRF